MRVDADAPEVPMRVIDIRAAVLALLLTICEPPDLLSVVDEDPGDLQAHLGDRKPHDQVPGRRDAREPSGASLDPAPGLWSAVVLVEDEPILSRVPLKCDALEE